MASGWLYEAPEGSSFIEKTWGRVNHDFHTDSSWDQTDHFFKEVFFIHHISPSVWHIESQPWILSASQLHFINRPLSATVGNHRSFKVKAVFAVSKSPVGIFSLPVTHASNPGFMLTCRLSSSTQPPPLGCLFPEDPASFRRSRVPFPVANLNHTRTQITYKHNSANLNKGFPSEIKMAMWFFHICPGLGSALLPWAWKGLAGSGSKEICLPTQGSRLQRPCNPASPTPP